MSDFGPEFNSPSKGLVVWVLVFIVIGMFFAAMGG